MQQKSTHMPYQSLSAQAAEPLPAMSFPTFLAGAAIMGMGGQLPGVFGAVAAFTGGALVIGAPALTFARTLAAGPK